MSLFEFFVFAMGILTAQNVYFARALDTGSLYDVVASPKRIGLIGSFLTIMTVISGAGSWLINELMPKTALLNQLRPTIFLAVAGCLYILLAVILQKYQRTIYEQLKKVLALSCINCLLLASLLICTKEGYGLGQTVTFAIAAGVGYTIAMLLVYIGIQRLSYCNVPKAFRGLPILMVYIGLISLAIFGILGAQLPA